MRAATIWAIGLVRATLVDLGELDQLGSLGLKGAVSRCGSAVEGIRAAVPVCLRAATIWAIGLVRATLVDLGELDQLGSLGLKGTVRRCGST